MHNMCFSDGSSFPLNYTIWLYICDCVMVVCTVHGVFLLEFMNQNCYSELFSRKTEFERLTVLDSRVQIQLHNSKNNTNYAEIC